MTDALEFATGSSAAKGAATPRTLADRIKADIAARQIQTIDLTHPHAAAWTITYRIPVDGFQVDDLRSKAAKKDKGKATEVHFSRALLATFCERVTFDGEVLEEDGRELTFRDLVLQDMVNASTASEAVAKVYGTDAAVSATASKLLDEAGYGSEAAVESTDPTQAA